MDERTRKLLADLKDCIQTFDRCIRELEDEISELRGLEKECRDGLKSVQEV